MTASMTFRTIVHSAGEDERVDEVELAAAACSASMAAGLDRRTAHRWVRSIAKRAVLGPVHPHMLRAALIMCALEARVPLREVQIAARHATEHHDSMGPRATRPGVLEHTLLRRCVSHPSTGALTPGRHHRLHQAVGYSEARGVGATRHAALHVDPLDVSCRCLGRDAEDIAGLLRGSAGGDQHEHLHLTRREACWPRPPTRSMADCTEDELDGSGIETAKARLGAEVLRRFPRGACPRLARSGHCLVRLACVDELTVCR